MFRLWIVAGSLAGLIAVAMDAAAAHALGARLDTAAMGLVRSANHILGWHALALVACGIWAERRGGLAHWAGAAFALGMTCFAGSLYLLALGGIRVPHMAPTGGSLLMLGWLLLAVSGLRRPG